MASRSLPSILVQLTLSLAGCGPGLGFPEDDASSGASEEGSGGTTGPAEGTDGLDTGSSGALDASTGAEASSTDDTGSESTGEPVEPADPCLAFGVSDCPEACMVVQSYAQLDDGCSVGVEDIVPLCVSRGEPLAPGLVTTFYAEIEGETRYLAVGQPCAPYVPAGYPVAWSECTGAPDEPEPCACLCGANGCPYEVDVALLDACEVQTPCGPTQVHHAGGPASAYDTCVLTALRDRAPGMVEASIHYYYEETSRAYLDGTEQGQVLTRHLVDHCVDAHNDTWQPTQRCTLAPPEVFDACLAATGDELTACLRREAWFTECTPEPASCP